jgi:putative colanic acid biosynthesis UDP-glucose lipid carrier transferase
VNDSILVRQSFARVLVEVLKAILPALVSLVSLYVTTVYVRGQEFNQIYVTLAAVATVLTLLLLNVRRFGTASHFGLDRGALVLSTLCRWIAILCILLALGYVTKSSEDYSRIILVSWALATPVLLLVTDLALFALGRRLQLAESDERVAVFAGCNEASLQLAERLRQAPELRIKVDGFFDDRGADRLGLAAFSDDRHVLLGRLPDMAPYVKSRGVDLIFIALPMRHIRRVIDLLEELRDTTASIYYVPDIFVYDLIQSRSSEVLGMPVIAMCETPFYGHRGVIKRAMDVIIASIALLLLSPLLLLIAVLVKLTSPGPVIFRQRRYGLDGEEIIVYKFRSMTVTEDGDEVRQARRGDSRLTPIGGFLRRMSLDELPQLINVLQGRMSLVGPRPHAVAHNEQYRKLIKGYMIRHKVRPGITGLAQVNGCRGETERLEEMQARVAHDIDYLRHWTLLLDLKILWSTFLMLLRKEKKAY